MRFSLGYYINIPKETTMKLDKLVTRKIVRRVQEEAKKSGRSTREQYIHNSKIGIGILGGGLSLAALVVLPMFNPAQPVQDERKEFLEWMESRMEMVSPENTESDYQYATDRAAKNEMCKAGRQYLSDVMQGFMTIDQAKNEVRQYSAHLGKVSPATQHELQMVGMGCSQLWN